MVLVSNATISAGDHFTVAMKTLNQHVTFVGRETLSFYSDVMYRELPNGMSSMLSNEKFYLEGHSLEKDDAGHPRGVYPTGTTKSDTSSLNYIPESEETLYNYYTQDSPLFIRALQVLKEKNTAR